MHLTRNTVLIAIATGFLVALIRGVIRDIRKRRRDRKNFDERVAERTREQREKMESLKQILEDKRRN